MRAARIPLILVLASGLASMSVAQAQTSPPAQPTKQEPDARYPNPSGQDSNPSTTRVKPTRPATSSKTPQDSTTPQARNETTNVPGKKADVAGGCSTPTDAASAGVNTNKPPTDASKKRLPAGKADQTVCTTSGENAGRSRDAAPKRRTSQQPASQQPASPPR